MKLALLVIFTTVCINLIDCRNDKPVNGDYSCAVCTIGVSLVQQLAEVHNETIHKSLLRFCSYLLPDHQEECTVAVDILDFLMYPIECKLSPDEVCTAVGFCYTEPGLPKCALYPRWPHLNQVKHQDCRQRLSYGMRKYMDMHGLGAQKIHICHLPGIKTICELFERVFSNHLPAYDNDQDGYSSVVTFRGTSWRGRDCDDKEGSIRPGSWPVNSDYNADSNCNGIYGVNGSGYAYEDIFCKESDSKGVILLGDSAGAHFHIPWQWSSPLYMNKEIFKHFFFAIENELDWPMMSAYTGYMNITWPITPGYVESVYHKLWQHNRCNHRDYQNIAVNGASSFGVNINLKSISRNQTGDKPAILLYALIGNDICNGYPDNETLLHMTTPSEMRKNVLKTLDQLASRLPMGSHVLLMGLADARILVESIIDRIHPGGLLRKDLLYRDVYNFINCLGISPCVGWLNPNATVRNITAQRAKALNDVLQTVAKERKDYYKPFEVNYIDCPVNSVIDDWTKHHGKGEVWRLVEPVDGFHPNQNALSLVAEKVWDTLSKEYPHIIGPRNPYNEQIAAIFGDQGGY